MVSGVGDAQARQGRPGARSGDRQPESRAPRATASQRSRLLRRGATSPVKTSADPRRAGVTIRRAPASDLISRIASSRRGEGLVRRLLGRLVASRSAFRDGLTPIASPALGSRVRTPSAVRHEIAATSDICRSPAPSGTRAMSTSTSTSWVARRQPRPGGSWAPSTSSASSPVPLLFRRPPIVPAHRLTRPPPLEQQAHSGAARNAALRPHESSSGRSNVRHDGPSSLRDDSCPRHTRDHSDWDRMWRDSPPGGGSSWTA
jgi:hypothetical protein